jgi:GNAT superfamily N-acetyltransferase
MQKQMKIKKDWLKDLNENIPHGMIRGLIFSGDRFSCCDEAVVLSENGEFIGIATISPHGEYFDGVPDIIGLYVAQKFRSQGYGLRLLSAAIERCLERGLPTPIRITTISFNVVKLCERLPDHLKANVRVIDASLGLILQD